MTATDASSSAPTIFSKKISETNSFIKFYETGGTASILAMVSAIKMGFSKVVFAGIDLAFNNNMIYANGEVMNRVSTEEIIVDNVAKNIVQVKSVNGDMVYTRSDYEAFIHHFEAVIKTLNYSNIYNLSTFGASINGVKSVQFEHLNLMTPNDMNILNEVSELKIDMTNFIQQEFANINNVITILSKDIFSAELITAIVKSTLLYQYMQSDVLRVLQKNFDSELAEEFTNKAKTSIKTIVDLLQKNKII